MAAPACQVLFQPERIAFLWSEGEAAFEPYYLSGHEAKAFRETLSKVESRLRDFGRGTVAAPAALVLAQAGHELYQQMFAPEGARAVRDWLTGLGDAAQSLTMVSDDLDWHPWSAVFDRPPRDGEFAKGGAGWKAFWGSAMP